MGVLLAWCIIAAFVVHRQPYCLTWRGERFSTPAPVAAKWRTVNAKAVADMGGTPPNPRAFVAGKGRHQGELQPKTREQREKLPTLVMRRMSTPKAREQREKWQPPSWWNRINACAFSAPGAFQQA